MDKYRLNTSQVGGGGGGGVAPLTPISEEMGSSLNKLLWSGVLQSSYKGLIFIGFHLQPKQPSASMTN